METPDHKPKSDPLQAAAENLFNYAIERDALKQMVAHLPDDDSINKVTVEYELQLLKIISVGWGIAFFYGRTAAKRTISRGLLEPDPGVSA